MARFDSLITAINNDINSNGMKLITGEMLNVILKRMLSAVGDGYRLAGTVDTSSAAPLEPDNGLCYLATEVGTYTQFGGIQVDEGEVAFLCFDTPTQTWTKVTMPVNSVGHVTLTEDTVDQAQMNEILKDWCVIDSGNQGEEMMLKAYEDDYSVIFATMGQVKIVNSLPTIDFHVLTVSKEQSIYSETPAYPCTIDHIECNLQERLVSGTNIKTVNGESILGSGDIHVDGASLIDDTVTSATKVWSSQKVGTELGTKADDSAVVHNTGDENIYGIKSFQKNVMMYGSGNYANKVMVTKLTMASNGEGIDANGKPVTDLPTPSADTDAANKKYVDDGLATKQDTLTIDATPTDGSGNPVASNGVYDALAAKQDTIADLATIRSGAAAGATAVQPATMQTGIGNVAFQTGEKLNATKVVNDLTTGGATDVLSAKQGKNLNDNKLDKVERTIQETWSEVTPETGYPKHGYVSKYGGEVALESGTIRVTKCSVNGGEDYYVTGKTGSSTSNALASFLDINGDVIPDSIYGAEQVSLEENRHKLTAPSNAAYILVMGGVNIYAPKCETKEVVVVSTKNNENIINSVGDVADLKTTSKDTIVNAINELKDDFDDSNIDGKLDKIVIVGEWQQQESTKIENGYINYDGIVTGPSYKTKTYAVTAGKKYKVKGRRAGSSSNLACFYVDDGEGGLTVYDGSVDKVGSEGVGDNITSVSNPVPDGDYTTSGGGTPDYHTEVYIAPNNCVAIKIMSSKQSSYPIECFEWTEEEINNQDVLDSVGDVTELDTENKDTIVDAINELNGKIPDSDNAKTLKVLLVGSSHGMNTISQFPWMLYYAGYTNAVVGNVYIGSFMIQELAQRIDSNTTLGYQEFNNDGDNPSWGKNTGSLLMSALLDKEWDVISLQRSASDDETWTASQAMSFGYVLRYISNYCKAHSLKAPRIIFNTGFADKNSAFSHTENIMSTAKDMKEEFGIEICPTAMAMANARNTWLNTLGKTTYLCYDSQHLDYGIGCWVAGACLYESIMKPLGESVAAISGYGTQAQQYEFISLATAENYTEPTEKTMEVAKACVLAAFDDDTNLNTVLQAKYQYPNRVDVFANWITIAGTDSETKCVATNGSYSITFTVWSNRTLNDVQVKMGGVDITSSSYTPASEGVDAAINIANVTGDIQIIIKTVKTE